MFNDYLWSPTPFFYYFTLMICVGLISKRKMRPFHIVPAMCIPVGMDYWRREAYVQLFKEDRKAFYKAEDVVMKLLREKTYYVSFEQVLNFVTGFNLSRPIN